MDARAPRNGNERISSTKNHDLRFIEGRLVLSPLYLDISNEMSESLRVHPRTISIDSQIFRKLNSNNSNQRNADHQDGHDLEKTFSRSFLDQTPERLVKNTFLANKIA